MSNNQMILAELLKLKASLLHMVSQGNFCLHPQDIIEQINALIEIAQRKED